MSSAVKEKSRMHQESIDWVTWLCQGGQGGAFWQGDICAEVWGWEEARLVQSGREKNFWARTQHRQIPTRTFSNAPFVNQFWLCVWLLSATRVPDIPATQSFGLWIKHKAACYRHSLWLWNCSILGVNRSMNILLLQAAHSPSLF